MKEAKGKKQDSGRAASALYNSSNELEIFLSARPSHIFASFRCIVIVRRAVLNLVVVRCRRRNGTHRRRRQVQVDQLYRLAGADDQSGCPLCGRQVHIHGDGRAARRLERRDVTSVRGSSGYPTGRDLIRKWASTITLSFVSSQTHKTSFRRQLSAICSIVSSIAMCTLMFSFASFI